MITKFISVHTGEVLKELNGFIISDPFDIVVINGKEYFTFRRELDLDKNIMNVFIK